MRRSRSPRASAPDVARRYKVVETSSVTDEELETILNDWTAKAWALDSIQFAMRESSKRPSMAFLIFSRDDAEG